ncbi:sporulation and spore germination protein [Kineococcus xinjiangensis]|uniref:Sporulation and spore germination protein n=1 Tax=Kineococcus xinjiangensis TaxID=512762 RepID=A0A2S6IJ08_9ACTN|nr:Gmad2 immunoglobulin-like domain-containing protein [Kineococcus xinjiangensis]PPK94140.1 sporulation and spore germination protein [Kineococcus xinjiangensis]
MSQDRSPHSGGPGRYDGPADAGPVPVGGLPSPAEDPTAALLHDAFAAHTAGLRPADRLAAIHAEAARRRHRRRTGAVAGVAAAALAVAGGAYAVTGLDRDTRQVVSAPAQPGESAPAWQPPAAEPAPQPTVSASAPTGRSSEGGGATPGATGTKGGATQSASPAPKTVPVYWLGGGDHPTGPKLYREYLPTSGTADGPTQALRLMLAGQPKDPDYTSPWQPDPQASVEVGADVITVTVSREAVSGPGVGSATAAMAVQQLVHTVTAAAGEELPVRIIVGDHEGAELWGAVKLPDTVSRAPKEEVHAPVWITSLSDGALVEPGVLQVEGLGTGFEANLNYVLTDHEGEEVARGYTTAGANGEIGPFAFELELTTGVYTLSVFDPGEASEGEGHPPFPDTKTLDVR